MQAYDAGGAVFGALAAIRGKNKRKNTEVLFVRPEVLFVRPEVLVVRPYGEDEDD